MALAPAIGPNHKSVRDIDLVRKDRFQEGMRELCGLFVVVVNSRLYLIHQAACEFLVSKAPKTARPGHNGSSHSIPWIRTEYWPKAAPSDSLSWIMIYLASLLLPTSNTLLGVLSWNIHSSTGPFTAVKRIGTERAGRSTKQYHIAIRICQPRLGSIYIQYYLHLVRPKTSLLSWSHPILG